MLMFEMDDATFKRHMRLTRGQFETLNRRLGEMGLAEAPPEFGGADRIPLEIKTAMFLWYMGNQNSYRELSDKFDVSISRAHDIISKVLIKVCDMAGEYITWPTDAEKQVSSAVFQRTSSRPRIIGAIDGCHIRILRPRYHGIDYMNRKGYYSVLLQGICDDRGKFIDVFVGPPGRVHDSRMLRESDFYGNWQGKMGTYRLLGDSAYISNAYSAFILTPKRNNGALTPADVQANNEISRGRVIIENTFGRMKCRFRRVRELQNYNILTIVRIILAACILHNMCMVEECEEHPFGCPRQGDDNA